MNDLDLLLRESYDALQENGDPRAFIEKWIPNLNNEILDLRNKVLLQDVRINELEEMNE